MSETTPTAVLSLPQQIESLWGRTGTGLQRVYAVVLGERVPGLRERLAEADVDDWDGLWTGELEPDEVAAAPHLVALRPGSAFAAWLAADAAKAYGDWGLFVCSSKLFIPMRSHGRALCRANVPDGRELRLEWADPTVLLALLPLAPRAQLETVFGGVEQMVIAGAQEWTRISAPLGRLTIAKSGVMSGVMA